MSSKNSCSRVKSSSAVPLRDRVPLGSRDSRYQTTVSRMEGTIDDAYFEGADIGCGCRVEGFDEGWSDYNKRLTKGEIPLMPDWRPDCEAAIMSGVVGAVPDTLWYDFPVICVTHARSDDESQPKYHLSQNQEGYYPGNEL